MNDAGERPTAVFTFGDAQLEDSDPSRPEETPATAGRGLAGLATRLTRARDTTARQALMRQVIQRAGFDWLCYWRIVRVGESVSRVAWFDTYSPHAWAERYSREQLFDSDPRIALACRFEWPFAWDSESLLAAPAHSRSEADSHRLTKLSARFGLHSGVSFGIATGNALEHCIVTLSSAQQGRGWIADTKLGEAYAIGVGLNAFIEARARHLLPTMDAANLNPVQRSILRYVTEGLSDREIAESLSTSAHNVGYHLRQLKKILNAQNRVQLAYIAGCILTD